MRRRKVRQIRYERPAVEQPGWSLGEELMDHDLEGARAWLNHKRNPANLLRIRHEMEAWPGKG